MENTTNIGTIDEFMMQNQRSYVVNQDNKHCLEDSCNDLSLSASRNEVKEASKRSRSKSKSPCKYGGARLNRTADFKSILQDLEKRYSTVNVVFEC